VLTEADILESGEKPEAPSKQEKKRVRRARERKRVNGRKCFDCTHKFANHQAMAPNGAWCHECNSKCAGTWES
jgi:hypothetical protein